MRFDVNVVPDASYHHDYEEMYDKEKSDRLLKKFYEDSETDNALGYYVDR